MFCYKHGRDVEVRTAVYHDIERMKDKMRESDVQEIWASNHHTPEQALEAGLEYSSVCLTMLYKGEPIAIFGAAPVPDVDGLGSIWLLGTDELSKVQTTFLKLSKKFIRVLLSEYKTLYNYVDERNEVSRRWLEWCGAKFKEASPYGVDGLPFRYFEFRRN